MYTELNDMKLIIWHANFTFDVHKDMQQQGIDTVSKSVGKSVSVGKSSITRLQGWCHHQLWPWPDN